MPDDKVSVAAREGRQQGGSACGRRPMQSALRGAGDGGWSVRPECPSDRCKREPASRDWPWKPQFAIISALLRMLCLLWKASPSPIDGSSSLKDSRCGSAPTAGRLAFLLSSTLSGAALKRQPRCALRTPTYALPPSQGLLGRLQNNGAMEQALGLR